MVGIRQAVSMLSAIHGVVLPSSTDFRPSALGGNLEAGMQQARHEGGSPAHHTIEMTFTVVNRHTTAVNTLFTRGCNDNGWSPFPTIISNNGTECGELDVTGSIAAGGSCSSPNVQVHLKGDTIEVGSTMNFTVPVGWHGKMSLGDASVAITGTSETLLEGSFGFQADGTGNTQLKLDYDVSMV